MSRYDEDTVVALLRESVPDVPDVPDRVALVRHRARGQRATLWTQGLGAVASVLLVVGVAAAVAAPGARNPVEPTSEPIRALSEAFTKEKSVRFEASMTPIGEFSAQEAYFEESLESRVTGAATRDGDLRIDGDLSFSAMLGDPVGSTDTHIRVVDGVAYRSVFKIDYAPEGKKWVRQDGNEPLGVADLVQALKLVDAVVEDVRYVGAATVGDVAVAEYRLTVPAKYLGQEVAVTFALDAKDRVRRIAAEASYRAFVSREFEAGNPYRGGNPLMVRIELLLSGYGDDVDIEAPPAAETITEEDLQDAARGKQEAAYREFQDCLRRAMGDRAAMNACAAEMGFPAFPPEGSDGTVGVGWTSVDGLETPVAVEPSPAP